MNILTCVVIGAVSVSAIPAASARPHYSLRADFSTTENPHGAWAYLQAGSPIPCQYHNENFAPELTGWTCVTNWDASVATLITPPQIVWHDAQLGDVVMHVASSPYAGPIEIRWTAPMSGVVSIEGRAWDASFDPSRDAGWKVLLNSIALAERGTIVGTFRDDEEAPFAANPAPGQGLQGLTAAAGDTITFTTYNISFYGHLMGLDIEIDLTPSCPGDTNGDGHVDFLDLNRVLSAFGAHQGDPGFIAGADLNGDDVVDFLDLNFVLSFFGQSC